MERVGGAHCYGLPLMHLGPDLQENSTTQNKKKQKAKGARFGNGMTPNPVCGPGLALTLL